MNSKRTPIEPNSGTVRDVHIKHYFDQRIVAITFELHLCFWIKAECHDGELVEGYMVGVDNRHLFDQRYIECCVNLWHRVPMQDILVNEQIYTIHSVTNRDHEGRNRYGNVFSYDVVLKGTERTKVYRYEQERVDFLSQCKRPPQIPGRPITGEETMNGQFFVCPVELY